MCPVNLSINGTAYNQKYFRATLKLDPFILLLLHPSSDSGADPGLILGCCQNFTKKIERRCNNDVICRRIIIPQESSR